MSDQNIKILFEKLASMSDENLIEIFRKNQKSSPMNIHI